MLLRELRTRGYTGGYTMLKDYVQPRRRRRQLQAMVRFETGPREQAQVDWGSMSYLAEDERKPMSVVCRDTFNQAHRLEFDYVRLSNILGIKTGRIGCHSGLGHRSGLAFPKPSLNSRLGRMLGSGLCPTGGSSIVQAILAVGRL